MYTSYTSKKTHIPQHIKTHIPQHFLYFFLGVRRRLYDAKLILNAIINPMTIIVTKLSQGQEL
jgi:hypothetical protein